MTDVEKPELLPWQTRRPKGTIIYHEVTVRCAVYRHGYKADKELKIRENQRVMGFIFEKLNLFMPFRDFYR